MRLAKYVLLSGLILPSVVFSAALHVAKPISCCRIFDVTAYAAGSYNYLQRSEYFKSGSFDRVNDIAENGARLQQLFLSVSHLPDDGLGGYIEMAAGLDAYSIAPYGWNADMFQIHNVGFAVPDFYLQYGYSSYKISAGVMEAVAGFESFEYLNDSNFSRGIIYGFVVPGVHIGLRGYDQVTSDTKFILGLTNGWASIRQPGHIKALEIGVSSDITEKINLLVDAYLGSQYLTDALFSGPSGKRILFDVQGTYNWTDALSLNWNLDYGYQSRAALPYSLIGKAVWAAAAGYVNYQFNDRWRTSVRAEIMNDGDGYRTGVPQCWKEVTLTFGYEPIKHLMLNFETRHDFSNVNAFLNKGVLTSNNNQQSYALEALYQFI